MRKILLSFLILILVGCSATDSTISDIPEEQAINKKTIVTSFYPLHFIAEKVVGENLIVENITKGKDPHSYSLTPKDIQALQDADLFVFQGAGLESWAEDIAENRTSPSFEVAENIDLLPTEESHSSENHKDDDHDDHEDHEEDGDNHDHHDHGAFDPHTWLDPMLLQETAQKLTQEIIALDPENQDIYKQNLQILTKELSELDQSFTDTLASCQNKIAISSHDAFAYAEKRYDFELLPISGLSPQSEPSSKDLQNLIQKSQDQNITHILEEEYNNTSFAQTIQRETGLNVLQISTLESNPGDEVDYIQVMQDNLKSFQSAFNCQ